MDKYIVKQISIDDGKTWFEAHFISPENYPAPKVHPTGGYGDIIEFTRDLSKVKKEDDLNELSKNNSM